VAGSIGLAPLARRERWSALINDLFPMSPGGFPLAVADRFLVDRCLEALYDADDLSVARCRANLAHPAVEVNLMLPVGVIASLIAAGHLAQAAEVVALLGDRALPLTAAFDAVQAGDADVVNRRAPEIAVPAAEILDVIWPAAGRPPRPPAKKRCSRARSAAVGCFAGLPRAPAVRGRVERPRGGAEAPPTHHRHPPEGGLVGHDGLR
jgi:hypothetical protein